MPGLQFSISVRLALIMALASSSIGASVLPGWTQEEVAGLRSEGDSTSVPLTPSPLSDRDRPATTVKEWITQIEASLVQITGVRLEKTETGLQVILETANGTLPVPETSVVDKAAIADIPNTTITEEFSQANPIEGIALVSVTRLPGDKVRVTITGTNAPPVTQVTSEARGLVFAVTQEDEIQVVVTGEQDEGYNPRSASTATRTDTPIRDTPQSIQVVPQEVIEDRKVRTLTEAVETVSGVVEDFRYLGSTNGNRRIRGFSAGSTIRNGFIEGLYASPTVPIATIDRVEVLKGPASVVIGAIEPGGIISYATKQPLSEPYYKLGFEVGNYGRYQPSIDFSGPLTADKNVLYRFIAAYENRGSFQRFANSEIASIAPSLSFKLGERTDLKLYYEYSRYFANPPVYAVPLLSDGSLPPRNLFPTYPFSNDFNDHKAGYTLTHGFNENWQIRNNFAFTRTYNKRREIYPVALLDDRFINVATFQGDITDYNYFAGLDLLGKFKTGSVSHSLLVGFDFNSFREDYVSAGNYDPTIIPPLDIRNPDYNALITRPEVFPDGTYVIDRKSYGIYLQDRIDFSDNLKLLIGGRYDWVSDETGIITPDNVRNAPLQEDGAFSPRIGLVYQPSQNVSLYASYSRSFNPAIGRNPNNRPFEPTEGTQYEVGVKSDFLDGRLSATLAAYHITKSNVLTPAPDPILAQQGFQVQVGEQRSRGIELDVTGEVLPGWKIIASYAHTDATVTVDNSLPSKVGNRLENVPQNQASLWTTYEIQKGGLQGLGFGLGLFYIGERQGDLANTFQIGDYLRTDAAVYYRRDRFNAAINIRNLFDIDYIGSVDYGNRLNVNRGEPFTIIGSVSWEF
ncbi:MAG: TonB-dependent siderophore receptor [Cyanosarcina radialis HA8281-LM2]|jgi:iron complex outermembrane receptor protein|nr:TonB-dependent siderophore receptor [Cyanosarcina radialis HA8281-LM2]